MINFISIVNVKRSIICVAVLAFPIFGDARPAVAAAGGPAERRVALVIGNSTYNSLEKLPNATRDVEEVASILRRSGFEVTLGLDVDRLTLENTVRTFLRSTNQADVGLVYYSGHGIQIGGQNYIVPTDATLESPYDVETQTMPLSLLLGHLKQNVRTQLVFLDACRNNPFNSRQYWVAETLETVGATRGLARVDSNLGSLIAFSTAPGEVALDGTSQLSPYTEFFVKHVQQPSKDILQVLTDVRRDVIGATKGKQVPWENSSLVGSFYFFQQPAPPTVEPIQQVTVAPEQEEQPLYLKAPYAQTGSELKVTITQVPQKGRLVIKGAPLKAGDTLGAPALAEVAYDSRGVPPGSLDVAGYSVSDAFGQSMPGLVGLQVASDAETIASQEAKAREEIVTALTTYVSAMTREITVDVGVGSVAANLPRAADIIDGETFTVKSVPNHGVATVRERSLDIGGIVTARDLAQLSFEPAIDDAKQKSALTLTTVRTGEEATIRFSAKLNDCDMLAAAPLDLQGVAKGLLPNEIEPDKAEAACGAAIATYPNVARFSYQLGRAFLANRKEKQAADLFRKALDAGHTRASSDLAKLYDLGALGTADPKKAIAMSADAAKNGDPFALHSYGRSLFHGTGVPKDTAKGLKLLLQAADLGHTYAMNELGYIFLNGVNLPADPVRGIRFFEAGVLRDDIYSMNNLASAYRRGKGVPQDFDKARQLFERASNNGHPYAPTNLARMYRDGQGVQKNLPEAIRWYEISAERGDYWGAFDRAKLATAEGGAENLKTAAVYFAHASAVNRPRAGDDKNQAATELGGLPVAAKKAAETELMSSLSAKEISGLPKTNSLEERLISLAKAGWIKRHPRYDLF